VSPELQDEGLNVDFVTHQHRFALNIVQSNPELNKLWSEISDSISSISDEMLKNEFEQAPAAMSLSVAINSLIEKELERRGWTTESAIFQGDEYEDKRWRLDFSKKITSQTDELTGIAVEVAFNHGEAIAWNLMKPVLAAEINQVELETEIGAGIGVYICATENLKRAGGFDGAVGEYEKVLRYLDPMYYKLTVPIIIVGLEAPKTFKIKKWKNPSTSKNEGQVENI
jgi:hypothetical protein